MTDKRNKGKKGGAKRHKEETKEALKGIKNPSIRRLARRGGVKRINNLTYDEIREILKVFLENVLRSAIVYMDYAKRKTITLNDIVHALKHNKQTLYT